MTRELYIQYGKIKDILNEINELAQDLYHESLVMSKMENKITEDEQQQLWAIYNDIEENFHFAEKHIEKIV